MLEILRFAQNDIYHGTCGFYRPAASTLREELYSEFRRVIDGIRIKRFCWGPACN
jgi:hypothetical protein